MENLLLCIENYLKLLHLKNVRYDGNKVDSKSFQIPLRKKKSRLTRNTCSNVKKTSEVRHYVAVKL